MLGKYLFECSKINCLYLVFEGLFPWVGFLTLHSASQNYVSRNTTLTIMSLTIIDQAFVHLISLK